jgi:hypothetical protein
LKFRHQPNPTVSCFFPAVQVFSLLCKNISVLFVNMFDGTKAYAVPPRFVRRSDSVIDMWSVRNEMHHAQRSYAEVAELDGPAFAQGTCQPMAQPMAQRRARALLAAWNSGNLARLEAALDENDECEALQLPAIERERFEVISEVANAIRGWIARVKTETELQAALLLLRHVGRTEPDYLPAQIAPGRSERRNHGMFLMGSRSI